MVDRRVDWRVDWRREIRARLEPLGLSAGRESDIVEELAQHYEDRHADLRARGHDDERARAQLRDELAREPLLESLAASERPAPPPLEPAGRPHGAPPLAGLWRDLRYGARSLLRAPGFTAVAVLTLALGIGATTAMFSVFNAVLLRALPFAAPEQLVRVYGTYDNASGGVGSLSVADFLALREERGAFSSIATYQVPGDGFSYVDGGGHAERVYGAVVSAELFRTLGVRPLLGRDFAAGDDADGAPPVVVLSYGFWQRRLAGDPGVLGRSLTINGRPATVLGVMPASVWFPRGDRAELWTNDAFAAPKRRGPFGWAAVARIREGVTPAARQAAYDRLAAATKARFPGGPTRWTYVERPLAEQFAGRLRPALTMLMGAVVLVLLIACVNVTNLMLARATSREQEVVVRSALGASRMALVRQMLAESVLLATAGGVVGVLLAAWGVRVLANGAPESLAALRDVGVGVDGRALGLAAAAVVVTVLLCGLAPALLGARADGGSLRTGSRGGTDGRSRRRMRSALVAAEFALSMMLLVGAGLLVRSLANLHAVDTGVRQDGVVTASIALPKARYGGPDEVQAFHDRLLGDLRGRGGIVTAAASSGLPPDVFGSSTDFYPSGRPPASGEFSPLAAQLSVDGEYFDALGIPLRAGRTFDRRDDRDAPARVVVSSALARRWFPRGDAVGQQLNIGGDGPGNAYDIVGVVGDVRYAGVADSEAVAVYTPFAQFAAGPSRSFSLIVRTPTPAADVASMLRAAVHDVDPELAVARVRTVRDLVGSSVAADRFRTTLLVVFAALALVLAAVGIYGVMAYAVGRRSREIGIRLALGARTREIHALVLGEGLAVAGAGVVVGLVLAAGATRLVRGLLFEVSATDATTFVLVPVVLLAVAVVACVVPARRAAAVDPALAMRAD